VTRRLPAAVRLAARRLQRVGTERPRLLFRPPPWALRPPAYDPGGPGFWQDECRRVAAVTANRVGKTTTAIRRLAKLAIENPRTRWRIAGPVSKTSNTVHGPILHEAIRDHMADGSTFKLGIGFNRGNVAQLDNGSFIQLMNYRQDPQAHASISLHGVLLDEPPPPAFFREAEKRVFDTRGFVWITMTAVDRPVGWLKKIVVAGLEQGLWSFHQVGLSADNCPWYTEDQVEEEKRRARLSPWSYSQTIDGEWEGVSADRWFVAYEPDRNLLPLTYEHVDGWPWPGQDITPILTADHGEGAGHSVWLLLGYQVRRNRGRVEVCIRVLAEWVNDRRMDAAKEARAIRDMVRKAGLELEAIAWAVGDTNANAKSTTATTLNELFEQEFAALLGRSPSNPPFEIRSAAKGPDSVQGGVTRANQLMDATVEGVPALSVHEGCPRLVETLSHWDGADDDLKHAGDAFRYGVAEICREVDWAPVRIIAA
jgi:hypothetical protein